MNPTLPDDGNLICWIERLSTPRCWDHDQELSGKRVAIIGTGASAIQVIPEIAPIVERLTGFQRTPIWCFPKFAVPLSAAARRMMRLPVGRTLQRLISQA